VAGARGVARDRKPHNAGTDDEHLHGQPPPWASETASPAAIAPSAVTSA
jgi:hypothetical protein